MIASLCLALAPALVDQSQSQSQPQSQPQEPKASAAPAKEAKTSTFSYTYVQAELVRGDADGFSDGPDGIELSGSYGLQGNLFVFGGISFLNGDVGPGDVDVDTLEIGIGYHQPLARPTDLVLGMSFLRANVDPGSDSNGYKLSAGVRHEASAQFELDGSVGYTDFDEGSGDVWLELGGVYRATPQLGLLATIYTSDDIDTITLGVRWHP
jgi:hypothetical protein